MTSLRLILISLLFTINLTELYAQSVSENNNTLINTPVLQNDSEQKSNDYHDKYEEPTIKPFDDDKYRNPDSKNFSSPTMVFYIGNLNPEAHNNLSNESKISLIGVSTQQDYFKRDNLSFELSVFYITRSYDTTISAPLFSSYGNRMDLETVTISAGVRSFWPEASPFRIFASGGLGMYFNTLSVPVSTFGFPGTVEQRSDDIQPYIALGGEYYNKDYVFQLQYRYMPYSASFNKFDVTNTDFGGNALVLGFGFIW